MIRAPNDGLYTMFAMLAKVLIFTQSAFTTAQKGRAKCDHSCSAEKLLDNKLTGIDVLAMSRSINKQNSCDCIVSFSCNGRLVVVVGPTRTASLM